MTIHSNGCPVKFEARPVAPAFWPKRAFAVHCIVCVKGRIRITTDGKSIVCTDCGTIMPAEAA